MFGTVGIRALRQHGALLPAIPSEFWISNHRSEMIADTKSSDLYHANGFKTPLAISLQSPPENDENYTSVENRSRQSDRSVHKYRGGAKQLVLALRYFCSTTAIDLTCQYRDPKRRRDGGTRAPGVSSRMGWIQAICLGPRCA